jgi:hypothetical protein
MIPLAEMEGVLRQLTALDKVAKSLEINVSLHIRK